MTTAIKHILFFEPRIEGHHLAWLPLVAEAMLDAGYQVTLALDERTGQARERIASRSQRVLDQSRVISAYGDDGKLRGGSKIQAAYQCFLDSGADEIFCNSLDEFTSSVFRKAAFGLRPPKAMQGKISGIYIRPRPLDPEETGLNTWLKKCGFKKMVTEGWFRCVYLLDEFMAEAHADASSPQYFFIPDPWVGDYAGSQLAAREKLQIPADKIVLLHYGTSSRRKGLHLLLEALTHCLYRDHLFLFVAGDQSSNPAELRQLEELAKEGRAKVMNQYIYAPEEKLIMAAADVVMLPYINHYGSSTVLSVAAAAAKPVLASDYHLLGRRVDTHGLGYTFRNDDARSLQVELDAIASRGVPALKTFRPRLQQFAEMTSITAFNAAVAKAYPP